MLSTSQQPAVKQDFRFHGQITDAAASAPRTIAEGFGRRTDADFAMLLDFARASLMECQNHLTDAADRGYIDAAERDRLIIPAKRAGGASPRSSDT